MNPTPAPYDVVAVLAVLGGLLFSNNLVAQLIAPYAAIFFASLVGTMWALSRRESDVTPGHRRRGAYFMFRVIGLALLVTVPISSIAAPRFNIVESRYLFAPIGFTIGAVGDDWKPFLTWCQDFILRWKSGNQGQSK